MDNYEYSSEDSLVKNSPLGTHRKSFRLKLIGKDKSSSDSSKSSSSSFVEEHKEISIINGFDEDDLPNWRHGIEGDLMRRISIKIGKLDSRRSLVRKQSLILLQKKLAQT